MNNNKKYEYKTPETSPRDPFGVDSPLTPENYSTHTPTFVAPPPPSFPPPLVTRPSTNPIVTNYINIISGFYRNNRDPVASIASFTNVFIDNLPRLDTTNPQQAIDLYNAIINRSSSLFRLNQLQNTNINVIIESAYIKIQLHYSNINIRGGRKSKKNRKTRKNIGKEDFGTWKDGSSVFKDKKGFFVIQWNPKKNMEYKKYLNNWKPKPQKNRLVLVKNKWYIKKSNKRKTRNKKKGGGNSISLFEEFKSLDELKSHLVNNIKVPTGSRSDPGKLNIDAVTRANNKTRNKENKSIHRKSLKKFNKRNNR